MALLYFYIGAKSRSWRGEGDPVAAEMGVAGNRTDLLWVWGALLVKGDKDAYNFLEMARKRARPRTNWSQRIFIILGLLVAFSMAISYLCYVTPPPPPPATPTPSIYLTPVVTPVF